MKMLKDLTKEERYELFDSWLDGADIQSYSKFRQEWRDDPIPVWDRYTIYRVKPNKIEG